MWKDFRLPHRGRQLTRDASYAAIDAFVALPDHLRVRAIYGLSTTLSLTRINPTKKLRRTCLDQLEAGDCSFLGTF